jgi:hypothetical protein
LIDNVIQTLVNELQGASNTGSAEEGKKQKDWLEKGEIHGLKEYLNP